MDNLAIYSRIMEYKAEMTSDDLIIVGWSHPSRKSFVWDQTVVAQQGIDPEHIIHYPGKISWFRSLNRGSRFWSIDNWTRSLDRIRRDTGNVYFDIWYKDYYADSETRLNFRAYLDSARAQIPGRYIPFYFSRESVTDVCDADGPFYLDMILENHWYIHEQDLHANAHGHMALAKALIYKIESVSC